VPVYNRAGSHVTRGAAGGCPFLEDTVHIIKGIRRQRTVLSVLLSMLVVIGMPALAVASGAQGAEAAHDWPFYTIVPFVLLLLAIAIMPLKFPHFWESNRNKGIVVAAVSAPVLVFLLIVNPHELVEKLHEYLSFIVLLWSLYTISGGIVLRGNLKATPGVNTAFLGIGAIIANLFGTTGASMLLIRPLLRTNQERELKVHTVVFFIFVVSNIGGCLTPLGDPPLYMGFMDGVPFQWTLKLWPQWLLMNGLLLTIYYIWDSRRYKQEKPAALALDTAEKVPLRIDGKVNIALILGVVAAVALSGLVVDFAVARGWATEAGKGALGVKVGWIRDGILVALGILSIILTKKQYREDNEFNFGAITEVAVLFIGIFITMIPALVILSANGDALGVKEPWQFFWITGALSSFLDNTPTYLVFLELAKETIGVEHASEVARQGVEILKAISLGAVFMGANTYIGNGPNFMVKAIAEAKGRAHVAMPSFGGYMLYSFCILIPLFIIITLLSFVLKLPLFY